MLIFFSFIFVCSCRHVGVRCPGRALSFTGMIGVVVSTDSGVVGVAELSRGVNPMRGEAGGLDPPSKNALSVAIVFSRNARPACPALPMGGLNVHPPVYAYFMLWPLPPLV
jgi:hypothetical protein